MYFVRFWNTTKALEPDHFNHTMIITNIMGGFHLGNNADCEALESGELREYGGKQRLDRAEHGGLRTW